MTSKDILSISKLSLTYVQVLEEENFRTKGHKNSYVSIKGASGSWTENIDFIKLSIFKN